MTEQPKLPDASLQTVLAALRTAAPPPGMESRILAAMEQAAMQQAASTPARAPWLQPRRLWLTTATSLAAIVLLAIVFHPRPTPPQAGTHSPSPTQLPPQTVRTAPSAIAAATPAQPERRRKSETTGHQAGHRATHDPSRDASLEADLHAPSYPAPPAPLTNEEKLLLRVAHHTAPQELASLTPDVRARQDVESKTEFQRFFAQVTPKGNE
jgi:hypothetical protein